MNQKTFALVLGAILFAVCSFADAQQPKKIPRIGYLSSLEPARESDRSEPFRRALRELGYTEGQNIGIEYRYAGGKEGGSPELAIVSQSVALIWPTEV